jgi:uncharacterized protein YdaU (DUF1376 family)
MRPLLNWMKFNVYSFMNSEDVQMMSTEEVGQYLLLLFAAWMGERDCTLPNDPAFLAKKAGVAQVSAKVLVKFQEKDGRISKLRLGL